jgi:hypothetical protein
MVDKLKIILDNLIIHCSGLAILALFTYTVIYPSFASGLLFIMFLGLSLADDTIRMTKVTLTLLTTLICSQYTINVLQAIKAIHGINKK